MSELEKELLSPAGSHGAVINKAAKHLPEGYCINIKVMLEGYGVELEYPDGREIEIDSDGGIIGDINEAICIANGFDT